MFQSHMRSFHEAVGDLKFRNSVGSLKKTHVKRQRFVHSFVASQGVIWVRVLKFAPMLSAKTMLKQLFLGGSQIWVNVCIWICFKIRGPKWPKCLCISYDLELYIFDGHLAALCVWNITPLLNNQTLLAVNHSITELSWMVRSYPFEKCGVSWDSQLLCFLSGRHWQGEFPCPSLARFVMCNLRQQLQLQVRQKKMRCQS